MRTVIIGYQHTLDHGALVPVKRNVFDGPSIAELRDMAEDDRARCAWCSQDYFRHGIEAHEERVRTGYSGFTWTTYHRDFYYYLSPFDTGEQCDKLCPSCSAEYEDDPYVEGFFDCGQCNRTISESHGMRSYYRIMNSEMLCVACFQDDMLADADTIARGRGGNIIREFAAGEEDAFPADWYNRDDLYRAGFEELDEMPTMDDGLRWSWFHLYGQEDIEKLRNKVRQLLADGFAVVVDQEATPYIGPVPVSIWVRDDWRMPEEEVIQCA